MLPRRYAGSTKWSQAYTSPLNSMASAAPHDAVWTQRPDGSPYQLASATSKCCTKTAPTSRRTHSSNTPIRNAPQPSGVTDRSVTSAP